MVIQCTVAYTHNSHQALINLSLDKMTAIAQTTFQMHWYEWQIFFISIQISLKFVREYPKWQ